MTTAIPHQHTSHVRFLLLPGFSLANLNGAINVLIRANQAARCELYEWKTLASCELPVTASNGLMLAPDFPATYLNINDRIVVCAGNSHAELQRALNSFRNHPSRIEIINPDAELSEDDAGNLVRMQETPSRSTELMVARVSSEHGEAIAEATCSNLSDWEGKSHCISTLSILSKSSTLPSALQSAIDLMKANIEEPLIMEEIATYSGISRRQLERLFLRHINISPARFYLYLRLDRARNLLRSTNYSIIEIALCCGFEYSSSLSSSYRSVFGIAPSHERQSRYHQKNFEHSLKAG